MEVTGKCVIGEIRVNNEDSVYISTDINKKIYIVADGMGGHNGGEVASRAAIDSFMEYINKNSLESFEFENLGDLLVGAVAYCNEIVYEKSCQSEELKNMGTTFTCLAIAEGKAAIAQVGDSRVYLLRNNKLAQLTKDHSYVMEMVRQGKMTIEEAQVHPKRNIITRAIGTAEGVEVDIIFETLEEKDMLLLCSDGLYSMLNDEIIEEHMKRNKPVKDIVEELVDKANENGGRDNISVIIVRYEVEA